MKLSTFEQHFGKLSNLANNYLINFDKIGLGYTDVEAAYRAMLEDGVDPRKIVLYGQSVGTAITAWLAQAQPTVAAVILQSPFVSGLAVLDPYPRACCPPS